MNQTKNIDKQSENGDSSKKNLKSALEGLENIFHELHSDSKFGKEMIDFNLETDFAKQVDAAIKNPLDSSYQAFQLTGATVQSLLNNQVVKFLKENNSNIKTAIKCYGSQLVYNIVLKSDNVQNRAKLLQFVNDYNRTVLAKNFDIIFSFIPEELESYFKKEHEVII